MLSALMEVTIQPQFDSLERLFRAHHGLVFRTAYRITGNATDAEDVLQTIFLRLARHDATELSVENGASYLRRAAVNGALDVVRARRLAETSPLDESVPGRSGFEGRELREGLRRALARLDPQAAEIFALRFFEGHSYQEIARALGMSRVGVAVTLHRARQRLKKELRSYMGGRP